MSIELTSEQLAEIMPKAKSENIDFYLPAINSQLSNFAIDTPLRVAHYIAQIAHESGSFRYKVENLNYSANALRAVFSKYFPDDDSADAHARQPEKIANVVYANRMGNGDTASGEGWQYRGRGLIQLTGKENYEKCGLSLGLDLIAQPELLEDDPDAAVGAACWYWDSRQLNEYADEDDIKAITRRINGGYNGLDDRQAYLERAKQVLNIN
ncbi:glycoside hydrolase family 19 [Saccharobesus litoralis]|uniref:Glycoside hydrolase family 19 n=1 Tax=Saccharobesus litoralis TaxID=2172099 RepID=A0A2S0VTG3_9ALTE|nr:glycoside hydrolase family 19 protein [Saccharobesus litoralis]AWB67504.1 glycoside hydrolase family 19 [Saccharobesus litoralis]